MNNLGGRRRSINAQQLAASAEAVSVSDVTLNNAADYIAGPTVKVEVKHEEKVQEPRQEGPVLSFVGLKACPKCDKQMTRGLAMHYRHCKGK